MKMKEDLKVLILTEAGENIGLGHVYRTFSLAQAFQCKKVAVQFLINTKSSLPQIIEGFPGKSFNWIENSSELFKELDQSTIVVIDSYKAPEWLYEKIRKRVLNAVCFDDYLRISYPAGFVVNGSINAEEIGYPVNDKSCYLLGVTYQVLRKEFWNAEKKRIKKHVNEILVTFGGDDAANMTPLVLMMLKKYPDMKKKVVVGRYFQNASQLQEYKDDTTEFIYYPDAEKMKKMMLDADITISSCGQTIYELARLGTPTISVMSSENQKNNVLGWLSIGFIHHAGAWLEPQVMEKVRELFENLQDYGMRQKCSVLGQNAIDGQGALRIVEKIISDSA